MLKPTLHALAASCLFLAVANTAAQHTLADAPGEWQSFLANARKADLIENPLQRCLAFPDLPGNQWPTGLPRDYCDELFGPRITLRQVHDLLARGETTQLDLLYSNELARHYSKSDFSEVSHRSMHAFALPESEPVVRTWLAKAPGSAFANAAMGVYLSEKARRARGGVRAKDISPEVYAKVRALYDEAHIVLERAIRIEPKLIHAHVELLARAHEMGLREQADSIYATVAALDPGCRIGARQRMWGLEPKWGGSMGEMEAFAHQLKPLVSRRPLLANIVIQPSYYLGHALYRERKYESAIKALQPKAVHHTYPEYLEELALSMAQRNGDDRWETLGYFLTASRFSNDNPDSNMELGRLLIQLGERTWAQRPALMAVKHRPEDPYINYLAGVAHLDGNHSAAAIPFLQKALKDPENGKAAQIYLVEASIASNAIDQAAIYSASLVADQPQVPHAWYLRMVALSLQKQHKAVLEAGARYMALIDRANPHYQQLTTAVEHLLAESRTRLK